MLAGLLSINTVVSALQSTSMEPLRAWQANPWSETNPYFAYPFDPPSLTDYMNASTIKVNQGVTTIDGVVYDELWMSAEGAQKVKANIFDFKTKWSILSGQAGTLATGVGTIDGMPVYRIGNVYRTGAISYPASAGTYGFNEKVNIIVKENSERFCSVDQVYNGQQFGVLGSFLKSEYPVELWLTGNGGISGTGAYKFSSSRSGSWYYRGPQEIDNTPFQFDYVSGVVPAEESDIPENYGLSLKIPHEKLETFYNTYPEYNVHNTTINIAQDEVDIDQLTAAIFDMIDSMDEMKAEWTAGEEPEPPGPVDPIENIDQNVQDITGYQEDMKQQVDHMHQDVEAIHQTQQQQQQVQQQMQQTQQQMQQDTSSIDSTLKDATATPGESDLPSFKFDLRELFPFCIPFDIYRLLSSFDATPQAPHVRLPIVIQSIGFSYTLDLDFSAWDPVAQAMRTAELIVYAIGLAWATGKVIKW